MELLAFLEARIAEDEDRARDFEFDIALALNGSYSNWEFHHGAPADWNAIERIGFTPSRILAECAAKRAIIAECREDHEDARASRNDVTEVASAVLYAMAAVHKDHPDFNSDWK